MTDFLDKIKQKLLLEKQIIIHCKINPNAPQSKIMNIMDDGTIKIAITAIPEKGKANAELIKFLSKEFETARSNISIISGGVTKNKLVKITI